MRVEYLFQAFILFFLCVFSELHTQSPAIDSLKNRLISLDQNREMVNTLNELSFNYWFLDPITGIDYANQAHELSQKIEYDSGYVKSYYNIGVNFYAHGQFDSAIHYLSLCIELGKEKTMLFAQYNGYNVISQCYLKIGDYQKALKNVMLSKELCEDEGLTFHLSLALTNIGNIYSAIKDTFSAIQYYEEAITLTKQVNAKPLNIGAVFSNRAALEPHNESKLKLLSDAIDYNSKHGFTNYLSYDYCALADYNLEFHKDTTEAYKNYKKALSFSNEANDTYQKIRISIKIGLLFEGIKERDSSKVYLINTVSQAKDLDLRHEYYKGLQALSLISLNEGKYSEAYELLTESFEFREMIFDDELSQNLSFANAQFETEKKEAEIARQELLIEQQKNTRNLLIGGSIGGLAMLSAFFFGVYQRNKRKRKETELALELEHKRAEDLENMTKVKTDFFNNVSHELRTPLTLVMAPLEDALSKTKHVEIRKDLDLALSNSRRLLNLTNEILDLSKIEDEKLGLNLVTIHTQSFFNRVLHSFDSLAHTRKIVLHGKIELSDELHIKTDSDKLEKIVANLISNAIKYSKNNGSVFFSVELAESEENVLLIKVKDEGVGIPADEIDHIFDRFYQSSMTNHSSGTGIGLALVKELVILLGGSISVTSELNKGSEFTFTLPFERMMLESDQITLDELSLAEPSFPPILLKGSKPTVLIVEDDLEMSNYLRSLLEDLYNCECAYNGLEALQMIKKNQYDLISSDVMMPEMDGFEFKEKLNASGQNKSTPFIMLTARALEEDKLKGFKLGVDDYITKPFSSAEFKARIYNLLSNKAQRDVITAEEEEGLTFDEDFVHRAEQAVMAHLDDPDFSVQILADQMNYSSRQLGRILQRITGLSPVGFILEIRLLKAYDLIKTKKYNTVKEVMHEIGIESSSYFSTKFKQRFGISPSDLAF